MGHVAVGSEPGDDDSVVIDVMPKRSRTWSSIDLRHGDQDHEDQPQPSRPHATSAEATGLSGSTAKHEKEPPASTGQLTVVSARNVDNTVAARPR